MMTSYFNLLKYAQTGIASPDMTYYDKLRASTLMGGATAQTLTGIPPLSFKSNGTSLISWSMKGNGSQQGTPTPDNPVMPDFVGTKTANLWNEIYQPHEGATVVYVPVYVGNGDYTLSTDLPRTASTSVGQLFLLEGNVSSGATTGVNDVYDGITRTVASMDGYITIGYRHYNRAYPDVIDYRVMLNLGSTALPYEPFGWAEKITCGGQTVPVYLGQVSAVRRVKKFVLTGTSADGEWKASATRAGSFYVNVGSNGIAGLALCDRATNAGLNVSNYNYGNVFVERSGSGVLINLWLFSTAMTLNDFKAYLASEYAAGHPVTIWYVLATEQTAIVNEPLAKIGDYADELSSEDASVMIPTIKGQNTLTVDTPIQPSEMTITYKG